MSHHSFVTKDTTSTSGIHTCSAKRASCIPIFYHNYHAQLQQLEELYSAPGQLAQFETIIQGVTDALDTYQLHVMSHYLDAQTIGSLASGLGMCISIDRTHGEHIRSLF